MFPVRWARIGALGLAVAALPAAADERRDWFDKATQVDLGGGREGAQTAYALYRQAAARGLQEAEFNVAVMLDSGRGVDQDRTAAVTWYARAAAHGNGRAAYNLGQMYEAGQGVPRNANLARAWFAASGLPAGHERLAQLGAEARGRGLLVAPLSVAPTAGARVALADGGLEFVWTTPAQAEPVSFTLEVRRLGPTGSEEVVSRTNETSSMFVSLPDMPGDYAWRVLAVAGRAGRYAPGAWTVFRIVPPDAAPAD